MINGDTTPRYWDGRIRKVVSKVYTRDGIPVETLECGHTKVPSESLHSRGTKARILPQSARVCFLCPGPIDSESV